MLLGVRDMGVALLPGVEVLVPPLDVVNRHSLEEDGGGVLRVGILVLPLGVANRRLEQDWEVLEVCNLGRVGGGRGVEGRERAAAEWKKRCQDTRE